MQALRHSLRYSTFSATPRQTPVYSSPFRLLSSSVKRLANPSVQRSPNEALVDLEGKQKEVGTPVDPIARKIAEDDRLPFLSRPLGVKDKPSTTSRSWREDMMDQDVRMKHRQKLVKEATKGYFTELNATRKHGGKTWVAPRVLIREDKALYFPNIVSTDLLSQKVHTAQLLKGKITVLAILSTRISEIQTRMFTESTNENYSSHPRYQFVRINLQENLLKSLLVSIFTSSIKQTVPQNQWGHYLVSSQNMDYIRDDLGIANKHVAHVFLVDENCKIRWAGCADPKPEEVDALTVCTGVLLGRQTA